MIPTAGAPVATRSRTSVRWTGWAAGMVFLYAWLVGVGHVLTGRSASGVTLLILGAASGYVTLRLTERGTPEALTRPPSSA